MNKKQLTIGNNLLYLTFILIFFSCQHRERLSKTLDRDAESLTKARREFALICSETNETNDNYKYCCCAFDSFVDAGVYNKDGSKKMTKKEFNAFLQTETVFNINKNCGKKYPNNTISK